MDELVHDAAERPYVRLGSEVDVGFWGTERPCAGVGFGDMAWRIDAGGSEISNLECGIHCIVGRLGQEDIPRFQVAVHNALGVHVMQAFCHLPERMPEEPLRSPLFVAR